MDLLDAAVAQIRDLEKSLIQSAYSTHTHTDTLYVVSCVMLGKFVKFHLQPDVPKLGVGTTCLGQCNHCRLEPVVVTKPL